MAKNRAGTPPSQRQLRVGEQVRTAISEMLARGDLYDDDLSGVYVTITEVSIAPNLKNAVVYAIPMGSNADGNIVIDALNRNANEFKHYVARNVDIRSHPRIIFKLDTSFDYAEEISNLINKSKNKDGEK